MKLKLCSNDLIANLIVMFLWEKARENTLKKKKENQLTSRQKVMSFLILDIEK